MRFVARSVRDLVMDLEGALTDERRQSYDAAIVSARGIAHRLPLVHRTGRPGLTGTWRRILEERTMRASDASAEERLCGWERAVYFFLGSAAYPKGNVAFLLERAVAERVGGSFSPFDSGALANHLEPSSKTTWALEDRAAHLAQHCGSAGEVAEYAGPYLAAHFRDPASYVTAAQGSVPDFDVCHGLCSPSGDRRAWTIEVRAHADVSVAPAEPELVRIVLANRALEADVPDELLDRVTLARADYDGEGDVRQAVAEFVLALCAGDAS